MLCSGCYKWKFGKLYQRQQLIDAVHDARAIDGAAPPSILYLTSIIHVHDFTIDDKRTVFAITRAESYLQLILLWFAFAGHLWYLHDL